MKNLISEKQAYWAWIKTIQSLSSEMLLRALAHFGSVSEVYDLAAKNSKELSFFNERISQELRSRARDNILTSSVAILEKHDIFLISIDDTDYPDILRNLCIPPPLLYLRGQRLHADSPPSLAVVGSRKSTTYGQNTAYDLSRALASKGMCIISGMAKGIDSASHLGALDSGAHIPTIAVLAGGLDKPYPIDNEGLFYRIAQSGTLVSENPPGSVYHRGSFPIRNRIIAGLSHACLIVEASGKSGANHTVSITLDLGREVFAIPGRVGDETSELPNRLIREGAKIVTQIEDILEEYRSFSFNNEETRSTYQKAKDPSPSIIVKELSEDESNIVSLIRSGVSSVDEMVESSNMQTHKLLAILSRLSRDGVVIKHPDAQRYEIK